jgi:hypothetical protein
MANEFWYSPLKIIMLRLFPLARYLRYINSPVRNISTPKY